QEQLPVRSGVPATEKIRHLRPGRAGQTPVGRAGVGEPGVECADRRVVEGERVERDEPDRGAGGVGHRVSWGRVVCGSRAGSGRTAGTPNCWKATRVSTG